MDEYLKIAIDEAISGVDSGDGGPFGACVVRNGEVIAAAHNEVIKNQEPTSHAEIQAIRKACTKLGRFDLSDCELYASCEPCPMRLAAAMWAKLPVVRFAATRGDAAEAGFDDESMYRYIAGDSGAIAIDVAQVNADGAKSPFERWMDKADREQY